MTTPDVLRRRSLRHQLTIMAELRDRLHDEVNADDFQRWADGLVPLTDSLIRDLMVLEGTPAVVRSSAGGEMWITETEAA